MWAASAGMMGVGMGVERLRRDRGGDVCAGIVDKGDRVCRGVVFKDASQLRQVAHGLLQSSFDEHRLPVEYIDM